MDQSLYITALVETAEAWSALDYNIRREAELLSLDAQNRFTEEALVFAINQQMSQLTADGLKSWIPDVASESKTIGVLNPGNIPFVGLQDFIAVTLSGHQYAGTVSSKSPALLPAFVNDLKNRLEKYASFENGFKPEFISFEDLLICADAIIASGSDETIKIVEDACSENGIKKNCRLLRRNRFSIAVLSGAESAAELESIAEDALLHEGLGCRNVSIIWAPESATPDALLNAMAEFRAAFPVHPDTAGSLKMTQAYMRAVDQPHGYGDNMEFLVSKGEAEIQMPGHIRWVEYTNLADVKHWMDTHQSHLQLVVCSAPIADKLGISDYISHVLPGFAQRPELSWCPDKVSIPEFLTRLS